MTQLSEPASRPSFSLRGLFNSPVWSQSRLYLVVVAAVILAGLISPEFLTVNNISNVLRQSAALGIVSIGQTLVMIGGGFDLSVASIMQLVTVMMGEMTRAATS